MHPSSVNYLRPIVKKNNLCIICNVKLPDEIKIYCDHHKINIIQKFLIRDILLPLRDIVNKSVETSKNECIDYLLSFKLIELYANLGTEIENMDYSTLSSFSINSTILGYWLLRITDSFPEMLERSYNIADSVESRSSLLTRFDTEYLDMLLTEFEFFYAAYFGINGLFEIALDSEESPSKIVIIPNVDEKSVMKMLTLRLRDSQFHYTTSFFPILSETTMQVVSDERGSYFQYPKEKIAEEYSTFKDMWKMYFGYDLNITYSEFFDFMDYFKWIVCPIGFTVEQKGKVRYLEDYTTLDDSNIFYLFNTILSDLSIKKELISTKYLGRIDKNFNLMNEIFKISWGFYLSTCKGEAYFLPVVRWLSNLLNDVYITFGRKYNFEGYFFEDWIIHIIESYKNGHIMFKYDDSIGYIPFLTHEKIDPIPDSISLSKILEKNLEIQIEEIRGGRTVNVDGEIDLIIYANYNLYFIELKSLNLDSKKAIKYLKKKAPIQCTKYANWIKQKNNLDELLKKHKISKNKLKSIRIICCTSGVYDNLNVLNTNTNEKYSVMPLFLFLNIITGIFTISISDVCPQFITNIRNGIKYVFPNSEVYLLQNQNDLLIKMSEILQEWYDLITFDRRNDFSTFKKSTPKPIPFTKFYALREFYIGDTIDWILKKPYQIAEENGIKYFVGTQISEAGSSIFCSKCNSVIKYYLTGNDEDQKIIDRKFKKKKCPICKGNVETNKDIDEALIYKMTMFMTNFKKEMDDKLTITP